MGGKGPGHKSPRARQARLINIQKARAARRRPPLPWRSGLESRVIEQLAWQWWLSPSPKWAAYRVARLLGVSHTWVNKLAKRFHTDPARFRRRYAPFAPATFDKLLRARQETLWHREHGRLRGPIRLRRVRYTLDDGKTRTARLPTRVSGFDDSNPDKKKMTSVAEGSKSRRVEAARFRAQGEQALPFWASGFVLANPDVKKPRGLCRSERRRRGTI